MSTVYGCNAVSDFKLVSDNKKQNVCASWNHIMENLYDQLSAKAVRDLLACKNAKANDLKEDCDHDNRLDKSHIDNNYEFLRSCDDRYVQQEREDDNVAAAKAAFKQCKSQDFGEVDAPAFESGGNGDAKRR